MLFSWAVEGWSDLLRRPKGALERWRRGGTSIRGSKKTATESEAAMSAPRVVAVVGDVPDAPSEEAGIESGNGGQERIEGVK